MFSDVSGSNEVGLRTHEQQPGSEHIKFLMIIDF